MGASTPLDYLGALLVLAVVVGTVLGLISMSIAQSKNRSVQWFWAGALLGIIGLIWIAAMPVLTPGQAGYIRSV